jgi:hypothetical protein
MTVRPEDPNIYLLVPYFGKEGEDFRAAIPSLESYLQERYTEIVKVEVRYRNPAEAFGSAQNALHLTEAILFFRLVKPFTDKILSNIADDAYKWLKRRFRVKKTRKNRAIRPKRRA